MTRLRLIDYHHVAFDPLARAVGGGEPRSVVLKEVSSSSSSWRFLRGAAAAWGVLDDCLRCRYCLLPVPDEPHLRLNR